VFDTEDRICMYLRVKQSWVKTSGLSVTSQMSLNKLGSLRTSLLIYKTTET
jgi:hypothetical protein